jgi:group I intron endonuclease
MLTVYRIYCRATGKSYIGATSGRLQTRMNAHRYRAMKEGGFRTMYPLSVAIRTHGWENFDVSVLSNHAQSLRELRELEEAAIKLFHSLHPHGYNQVETGNSVGTLREPSHRPAWNRGVTHSDTTKALLSSQRQGADNARARAFEYLGVIYGCMQECVTATGLSRNALYGRLRKGLARYLEPGFPGEYGAPHYTHTEDTKRQMSAYRLLHHPRRRAILLDGKEYVSIVSAVGVSGYSRDQIKKKLKKGEATYLDVAVRRTGDN